MTRNPILNFTEAAIASQFAEQHVDRVRYVAATKKWFVKLARGPHDDGPLFSEPDTKLQVLYLVQTACMDAAVRSGDPTLAKVLCSANTISAVERLANPSSPARGLMSACRRRRSAGKWEWDERRKSMKSGLLTGKLKNAKET